MWSFVRPRSAIEELGVPRWPCHGIYGQSVASRNLGRLLLLLIATLGVVCSRDGPIGIVCALQVSGESL